MTTRRCAWPAADPLLLDYHDTEWGVPLYDDRRLFEFLVLETMQAGLSWLIVLRKREGMRRAFDGFRPERVARFDERRVRRLLQDEGIIRNRQKVQAAVTNARVFLRLQKEHGSFSRFLWGLIGGRPIVNTRRSVRELPATTPESDRVSKALKAEGFSFIGSTVCYAHMQATGMVNDHMTACFRYRQVQRMVRRLPGAVGTVALLLALALPSAASAETIHLKNGRRIEAKILTQDRGTVVVDWYGVPVTYWPDQIDHITSGAPPDAAPPADHIAELFKEDQFDRVAELVEQGKRFCDTKQYGEAEQVAVQAVDLAEREFGPDDVRVVQPLLLLSYVYLSQHRVEEGIAFRDRADAIERALGPAS